MIPLSPFLPTSVCKETRILRVERRRDIHDERYGSTEEEGRGEETEGGMEERCGRGATDRQAGETTALHSPQ